MRKWFKSILGITNLEEKLQEANNTLKTLRNNESFVLQEINNVKELINVGVDLNLHNPRENWAVICVQGKPDYVRFVSLDSKQIRDVERFLRNFDHRNVTLDAPRMVSKKRLLKL